MRNRLIWFVIQLTNSMRCFVSSSACDSSGVYIVEFECDWRVKKLLCSWAGGGSLDLRSLVITSDWLVRVVHLRWIEVCQESDEKGKQCLSWNKLFVFVESLLGPYMYMHVWSKQIVFSYFPCNIWYQQQILPVINIYGQSISSLVAWFDDLNWNLAAA